MASVITLAFENWKAQEAASGKAVLLDEFVFANVPNLDPSQPIDRNEKLPPANQIVHRQAVNKAGLASENAVAYSVTLGAEVGNFDFNWIGLLNKASGTVAMITHAPTQKKLKNQNGQQGNVLTRSFILEFQGAAEETQIKTSAETWQIDFTARLSGIDEMQRLINVDSYGAAAFFNDGFEVTRSGEQYTVKKGLGYVGGLRGELAQNQILNGLRNTKVYADFSYQGNIVSQWNTVVKITSVATLNNYVDAAGFTHQVFAIASIDASGNVKDLRPMGGLSSQEIVALETRFKLDLSKKIDKANVTHQTGNSTELVVSQQLLTTEMGKKQPAGNYADGDRFKTNASNVSISPKNGNIWLILQADGELFTWDGNKSVFRVSSSGEITLGSMSYSRLTNIPVVQTTGNSLTSFMSQKAVTDLVAGLQLKGNYADGSRFQVGSNNVSMTPANSTYSLALDVGGELLIWDGSKSIFRVSSSGEITLGSMGYSRLKNVPIVQTTGNSATSFMSQKAVTDILVGVGELRDLSGQRTINTTYTNSSSRPRFITITGDSKETGTASVVVNGITIQGLSTGGASTLPFYCSFFVPIGGSYRLNSTGAFNLGRWTELS
ncbi:phage tail protein [Providencia rettgeri]